jgi:hypothetical protein
MATLLIRAADSIPLPHRERDWRGGMDVVYEAEDVKLGAMSPRCSYLKSLHGDSILECHQSFWNRTKERGHWC